MFANNRTDSILAIDVPLIHDDQPSTGGVGVGSWNTSVEFKDLSVSMAGAPVKLPELGAGVSGLTPNAGEWGVRSGVLGQTKLAENAFALIQAPALHDAGDYTFKLRARRVSGAEGFLILFHARDDANWTWLNVGGWGNTRHALERSVSGMKSQIGASVTGIVENNRWYDVRIELEGRAIRCFLDDSLIIDAIDRSPSLFAAVAGRVTSTEEVIIKAANASASPVRASLVLDGLANTTRTGWAGSVTVLTSPSLADENSFATPRKIVPVSLPFRTPSRELEHEFPARSLTVLRIKPRD
jgi:alpha-L-arabinofuranosidase